jgi:hypothetical protein
MTDWSWAEPAIVGLVTAMYTVDDEDPGGRHPLRKGASPEAIRSALLPEDQADFDADYEQALSLARTSRDLTELFTVLEHWRRLAMLQSEPEVFRRVARRAAELHTGQLRPEDEPLSVTRAHTGI